MTEEDMKLPEGETCGDCNNYGYCKGLFGCKEENTSCDYSPHRFSKRGIKMKLKCNGCGKVVSNEVPDGVIVRAWIECPECIEKEPIHDLPIKVEEGLPVDSEKELTPRDYDLILAWFCTLKPKQISERDSRIANIVAKLGTEYGEDPPTTDVDKDCNEEGLTSKPGSRAKTEKQKTWPISLYGCHFLRIEDDGDCHNRDNPLKQCTYDNCPIKIVEGE